MRTIHVPQCVPSELPDVVWDAVVVGGGPAGAIAALALARRGRRVVLLERWRYPRDKACGDGLIPDAIACLARHGLLDRVAGLGRLARAATVFSPSRIEVDVAGEFLCVRRQLLDAVLAAAAAEAGATVCQAQVRQLAVRDDGTVEARLRDGAPVVARVAVVATGANVSLLAEHGMVERAAPSGVALRGYVRSARRLDRLLVSFDRSIIPGYAWIFPVGDDEYNVGCGLFLRSAATDGDADDAGDAGADGAALRGMLARFCDGFPAARALLAGDVPAQARGARLRCGLAGTRPWDGRAIVPVGEAVGATFAFTGEGIGKAMETAELAAGAIDDALTRGDPAALGEYERRLDRELRPRYLGYDVAQRWLGHARVNDLVARRARRSPALRDALAGLLAGTVEPRRVFSLSGLARTWLG
jgi:geranylgeranyl reductase family protein